MNQKTLLLIGALALSLSASVQAFGKMQKARLDKVIIPIQASQWIKTDSAKVTVGINMALNKTSLVAARAKIMQQLQHIAKGEWHLTRFNRSQDSSGLQRVQAQAQARVEQSVLPNVYANAKSSSNPGSNYSISNIDFTPSMAQVLAAQTTVRVKIYEKINHEIKQLNNAFSGQKYSVFKVNFANPVWAPQRTKQRAMNLIAMPAQSVQVSNKVSVQALVILASNRDHD